MTADHPHRLHGNLSGTTRWLTGLLMSGCLLASQVGAAPSGKDMTIWFDLGGPVGESYVTVVQNGAKQAAEDLGVALRLVYSDWQPQKMIENFKQAVAAKPTGIVVMGHPGDSAYQPLIADAITKGIKVSTKLLNNAPQSITIGPRGSSRGDQIKRGGI